MGGSHTLQKLMHDLKVYTQRNEVNEHLEIIVWVDFILHGLLDE